jgi:large conductance mechanosensitive channel
MLKEFKEFAMKSNLLDMAIGIVMGGAFGKLASSFTDGIVI